MHLSPGDSFLFKFPHDDFHLFFVVTKIVERQQYVCVMLSSWKEGSPLNDPACILEAGEHPFVTRKSYIAYKETLVIGKTELEKMFMDGRCKMRDPVGPDLLNRIKKSASASRKIPFILIDLVAK